MIAQLNDAVNDGIFWGVPNAAGTGEQEHRAVGRNGDALQFMDKLVEVLLVLSFAVRSCEAIKDENGRATGRDLPPQQVDQAL